MEIPLHGQFTEQDLRRSLALMRGRQFTVMWIFLGLVVVCPLVSAIIKIPAGKMEPMAILVSVLPILFVLILFASFFWMTYRSQPRKLLESPLLRGAISGVVTDEALELRSEQSEAKTKWGAFVQYKMSDHVVLLYQNKAAASIVPRSFFASDEDWQQFQQFIQATVPAKAKTQGGILRWRWILYLTGLWRKSIRRTD